MTAGIARQADVQEISRLVRFVLDRLNDDSKAVRRLAKAGVDRPGIASLRRRAIEIDVAREIVGVVQRMAVLRDLPAEQPVRDGALEVLQALAAPYLEDGTEPNRAGR